MSFDPALTERARRIASEVLSAAVSHVWMAGGFQQAVDPLAERIAAFAAEVAEERIKEHDLQRLLSGSAGHRHAWTWSDGNTHFRTTPPPDAACVCGMTYIAALAEPRG